MKRAMAALTVAAWVTLLVDVAGGSRVAASLIPATAFLLLSTLGLAPVQRRGERWAAYAYIAALFLLGYAVFTASSASVGATLMLIVLVGQTVLLLPTPAVVVVVVLLPLFHVGMALAEGVREGLGLLAAAVFAAVLTELLVREQAAREQLRAYAIQVERLAVVQERNRVARDIHDGLGHGLTVVQMQIKAARAVLATDPGRADKMLAKAQGQAEEALREVRRSVGALREQRAAVPLPEALRALAEETSAAGVPTQVGVTGSARPLAAAAEESLFRAAQEGLTNVRKHAGASRAALVLDYSHASAVRLEVRDNGTRRHRASGDVDARSDVDGRSDVEDRGDLDGVSDRGGGGSGGGEGDGRQGDGFGLLGLRERAAHLGGRMTWESVPGRGSTLRMELPG